MSGCCSELPRRVSCSPMIRSFAHKRSITRHHSSIFALEFTDSVLDHTSEWKGILHERSGRAGPEDHYPILHLLDQ
jgi:predicted metal-binding protein